MSTTTKIDIEALETEIDRHGLTALLLAVAEICHEKAHHVRTTWQDVHMAKAWTRAAKAIERASTQDAIALAPL